MRILVTGATGFIGTHLVARLLEQHHEVFSLHRYVTGRYVLGADRGLKSVFCDLRDHFAVRRIVHEIQPEAVIHLAAISPVSYSYDHPHEVLDVNINGTVNLAEACLREVAHVRQFLFASTSETFGNGPLPKKEDTPQAPNSPYSVGKLAAEKYVLYMRDAYGFPVTVLRPFNTYGRKDNTHFMVERIVVQMLRGDVVRLGDPSPVRDLLYVDDHVSAYMSCLGNDKAIGEIFNFATGQGITVGEVVKIVREKTNFRGEVLWDTIPRRPLDIQVLYGDSTKAEKVLGWRATLTLDEGLDLTVDYWRKKISSSVEKVAVHTAAN